jgi:hypothetical protein
MSALGRATLAALLIPIVACYDSAMSPTEDLLTTPNDLVAVVTQISYDNAFAPAGFQLDQYELFVTVPPATQANAGLVLGPRTMVFRPRGRSFAPLSRSEIVVGDTLKVWLGSGPAYGSVQAPEGAPAYGVNQVVLLH